jgi:hypothetical protein
MDCEKFDRHVIDALYDELDELTHAALKRHVEGCSRCAGIYTGLRATREVGILPIEEPSDDLEARILDAVAVAQKKTPWPRKVLRGLAWAGSHAMRPQLAMAAVFVLVIGSSLLVLRARPGSVQVAVRVTERGSPAAEPVEMAAAATAAPTTVATAAASAPADPLAGALAQADAPEKSPQRRAPAEADGEKGKAEDSAGEARTALAEARTTRETSGCSAAVSKFDGVAVRFAGTPAAADAMWEEASCYKQMGDAQRAQQLYLALRSTGYRDRAEAQLAEANANNTRNQAPAAVAAAPAAPPPAPVATAVASAAPDELEAKQAERSRAVGAGPAQRSAPRPAAGAPNSRVPAAPAKATVRDFK